MIPSADIEELANRMAKMLPSGTEDIREDLQGNLHAIIQAWLGQLNLVTREEFDAQSAVLARTRDKLQELEQLIQSLERSALPENTT